MADDGRADFSQDGRLRAMVLPATFASLRWGEITALTRADVDLTAGTVRVRAAFTKRRSNGSAIVTGPPKSRAGRRVVGIPKSIIPDLEQHLAKFVGPEPGALVFCGLSGVPLRRSNFGKMSGWPHAVRSIGAEGLHFHDLRHTGNTFAAAGGAGIRDLMARMGHDSERAALVYQHQARGADKTRSSPATSTLTSKRSAASQTMARRASWYRLANGPLMARTAVDRSTVQLSNTRNQALTSQDTRRAGDGNRTRMTSLEGSGSGGADVRLRRSTACFRCP
jgi:hypothetical protein